MRIAVVRDFREERWPSMDLVADMLLQHLEHPDPQTATIDFAPRYRHLLGALPFTGRMSASRNFDRMWNRFVTLPKSARRSAGEFDRFHIVDHSYAHLVHSLPAERTGVYCHDLDTFRCLLEPAKEPRPLWFRAMARRILSGLQAASIVFHSTQSTGAELIRRKLIKPERLRLVHYGIAPEFSPAAIDDSLQATNPDRRTMSPYILHIGSNIPRKRIDILLEVFARLRAARPDLTLVKVGDPWTSDQLQQIERLSLAPSIRHLGKLSRPDLAETIRRAAVVVIPSDAEGFGLPVIEALACDVPVVASDLPTLREAGGDAARYAPVGDVDAWVDTTAKVLASAFDSTERERRLSWAAQFTWEQHARAISAAYKELNDGHL